MRPVTALAVIGSIALPWYSAVAVATDGAWLAGFLGTHNVGRFVNSMEGHKGPIVYYVVAIAIGFFPWSVFLLPALQRWRARRVAHRDPGDLFLACWAGFYIGFFSLAGTKLPNYVLPAYPPLALLTGILIVEWSKQPALLRRIQAALAFATLAAVGIGLIIALPIVAYILLPGEWLLPVAGIVPLVAGIAALRLLKVDRLSQAFNLFGVAAVLQTLVLFGWIGPRVAQHHTSATLIAQARNLTGQDSKIAVYHYFEPSLVYYARDRVDRFARPAQVTEFLASGAPHYIITHEKFLPEIEGSLPPGVQVLARKHRFLRRGDVLLLGPATDVARRNQAHTSR
jgi:4-amino-4-deoxy-L-arabinose transferase-like glycosyltransferase